MGREKPCLFCTRELLLNTRHHTGMYDHSDMFAKVAPIPPDKIGTVSVSAGKVYIIILAEHCFYGIM
jgi:hypothetical protein